MKRFIVLSAAVLSTLAVVACSDDDHDHGSSSGGHDSAFPTCKQIIDACHEVDIGEGAIHDCHDTAHDAKADSDCTPTLSSCLQTCNAAKNDAGTSDAGTSDGSTDAATGG